MSHAYFEGYMAGRPCGIPKEAIAGLGQHTGLSKEAVALLPLLAKAFPTVLKAKGALGKALPFLGRVSTKAKFNPFLAAQQGLVKGKAAPQITKALQDLATRVPAGTKSIYPWASKAKDGMRTIHGSSLIKNPANRGAVKALGVGKSPLPRGVVNRAQEVSHLGLPQGSYPPVVARGGAIQKGVNFTHRPSYGSGGPPVVARGGAIQKGVNFTHRPSYGSGGATKGPIIDVTPKAAPNFANVPPVNPLQITEGVTSNRWGDLLGRAKGWGGKGLGYGWRGTKWLAGSPTMAGVGGAMAYDTVKNWGQGNPYNLSNVWANLPPEQRNAILYGGGGALAGGIAGSVLGGGHGAGTLGGMVAGGLGGTLLGRNMG